MILSELFEVSAERTSIVWSKRGKDLTKRIERKALPGVRGRSQIETKKDKDV